MKNNKTLILIFVIYIFSFSILGFILPDKCFSEMENRVLEKKPRFSFEDVFSGRFTTKYENYITDNFPFRDFFVKSKVFMDVSLLKKENKGIYMGKDGYLIEEFKEPDKKKLIII